jgi:FtsH-binding integral membrane protein
MFTRWPLRTRALYNLGLGGFIMVGSLVAFFTESHAAIVGILIGVALLISGWVLYNRSKAEHLKQPTKLAD